MLFFIKNYHFPEQNWQQQSNSMGWSNCYVANNSKLSFDSIYLKRNGTTFITE